MNRCPPLSDLQQLLDDQLRAPEAQSVEDHLEICASCQRALEELTRDSRLPGKQTSATPQEKDRADAPADAPADANLADLVRRLENEPMPGAPRPADGAAHPETQAGTTDPTATVSDEPERRGPYTLARVHAQGGIGVVWAARDPELDREIALKELRPEQAGKPAVLARFLEEARITGKLEHPGIVPVYQLARRTEEQSTFYTMRLVRGPTLNDAIRAYHQKREAGRAGPLDLRELLGAFVGVCNAVAYAHSRGVIHRDLKGQNVVLGDFGEVMVLDWGLAKVVGGPDGEPHLAPLAADTAAGAGQTVQGQVLGTPAYMAPEQAQGRLDLLDRRTDVYGLGAILYEILTGQAPFTGTDTQEVLRRVIDEPPVPPRQRVASTPPALQAVCLKALAKRPESRYGTARELAQEVQRWLADEPVTAYPEPWATRARRWLGKHRALTASVASAVLVVAAGLAVATAMLTAANERERQSRARAEENFKLARDAVDRYFTKVSGDNRLKARGLEKLRRDLLQEAKDFYERFTEEQGDDPVLQAERAGTHWRLGRISVEIGEDKEAARQYEQALAIMDRLTREQPDNPDYQQKRATTLHDLAILCYRTGQADRAREAFEQSVAIQDRLVSDHPDSESYRQRLSRALTDLGVFYASTNQLAKAEAAYLRALPLQEELSKAHPKDPESRMLVGTTLYNLGRLYRDNGRPAESLDHLEKALGQREKLVQDHPEVPLYRQRQAQALIEVGMTYAKGGQPQRGAKAYERAITLLDQLVREHPDVPEYKDGQARALGDLGLLHSHAGHKDQAQLHYERALAIYGQLADAHPDIHEFRRGVAIGFLNLGDLFRETGGLELAEDRYGKALAVLDVLVQKNPQIREYQGFRINARLGIAGVHACFGRHARATAEAEALLGEPALTALNRYDAACAYGLACAAVRKDDKLTEADREKLAEQYATRAVALISEAWDRGYRDLANIMRDTDLEALRGRADFQKLVRELADKAKAMNR
jgi:serine/threonine-protein kinase